MRTRFQPEQYACLAVLIALLKSITARWILVAVALSIPLSAMAGEHASTRTHRFVLNVTTFQEDDWKPSGTFQTGIVLPVEGRARWYRIGVELYDGRSQLDSFFPYRERYIVFGAWLDL